MMTLYDATCMYTDLNYGSPTHTLWYGNSWVVDCHTRAVVVARISNGYKTETVHVLYGTPQIFNGKLFFCNEMLQKL